MNAQILILTAGFGEGHNAAARALAAAFDEAHGAGTAEIADIFALTAPRWNAALRRSYLELINRAPGVWNVAYRWLDRSPSAAKLLRLLTRETRLLGERLRTRRYRAVCCTYPVYGFMLEHLGRRGGVTIPWFNIVTDSISINSLWWRAGGAGWYLPNEDSAAVLRAAGLPEERLQVLGFPVDSFFRRHAGKLAPPDLARGKPPRVLYIINSGVRHAAETARRLLRDTPWEITCTVGRQESLQRELAALASKRTGYTRILGWTSEIPRLLMTHHVVISKAGGATTQEALAARCPMIVNQIVPGQEEGNYELLRRHGVGARAETPEAVIAELGRAFAGGGAIWRQWRSALEPLSRPAAARAIADAIAARVLLEPVPLPLRAAAASA